MKILLIVDCYLPDHRSSATLINDLGLEFARMGHLVTVLAPSEHLNQSMEIGAHAGMRVVRVKAPPTKGVSKPIRAVREMRLSSLVWRYSGRFLLQDRPDLIIFYSPTIFWGPLVKRLKSLHKCPAYLVLRDIFPKWAVDAGVLRKGIVYHVLRHYERLQYRIADVIGTNSTGDLEYFRRDFPKSNFRIEVLHNWVAPEKIPSPAVDYRLRLGLTNKVVFVYGGNIGVAQDMDNVLRLAINLAAHPDVHILVVGEGTEAARVAGYVADRDLTNVTVVAGVSRSEYLPMLSQFDVGLISLDRRLTTHNIPGKLLSYGLCAMPVLASVNPGNDLIDMLHDSGSGFASLNGDDVALMSAAVALAKNPELRVEMGGNCRKLIEERFSVRSATSTILRHFETSAPCPVALDFRVNVLVDT